MMPSCEHNITVRAASAPSNVSCQGKRLWLRGLPTPPPLLCRLAAGDTAVLALRSKHERCLGARGGYCAAAMLHSSLVGLESKWLGHSWLLHARLRHTQLPALWLQDALAACKGHSMHSLACTAAAAATAAAARPPPLPHKRLLDGPRLELGHGCHLLRLNHLAWLEARRPHSFASGKLWRHGHCEGRHGTVPGLLLLLACCGRHPAGSACRRQMALARQAPLKRRNLLCC